MSKSVGALNFSSACVCHKQTHKCHHGDPVKYRKHGDPVKYRKLAKKISEAHKREQSRSLWFFTVLVFLVKLAYRI